MNKSRSILALCLLSLTGLTGCYNNAGYNNGEPVPAERSTNTRDDRQRETAPVSEQQNSGSRPMDTGGAGTTATDQSHSEPGSGH